MFRKFTDHLSLFFILYYYLIICRLISMFTRQSRKFRKNSVLYLESLPVDNSGYQYRAAKWAELMNKNGFHCEVKTIIESRKEFEKALTAGNLSRWFRLSVRKRFRHCLHARKFETVIVRRELLMFNNYGNLFMEKFLLSIHSNVILDFDDDMASARNEPRKVDTLFGRLMIENGKKFTESVSLYKKCIVASKYLKQYVLKTNPQLQAEHIAVIPTCVDYNQHAPKVYIMPVEKLTFGWIGGNHNYHLLEMLLPILNELSKEYSFKLNVIGGKPFTGEMNFEYEFFPWSLDTEVEDLLKIDVGLMPLTDDDTSKGKGGFKLIQYMGLGIVSVASPVTINCEIVEHGVDSFLAATPEDWKQIFKSLLSGTVDLEKTGKAARNKILGSYTFLANNETYIKFLRSCAE